MEKQADSLKYNDDVKVTGGFFKGLKGKVFDYDKIACTYWTSLYIGKDYWKCPEYIQKAIFYEDLEKAV